LVFFVCCYQQNSTCWKQSGMEKIVIFFANSNHMILHLTCMHTSLPISKDCFFSISKIMIFKAMQQAFSNPFYKCTFKFETFKEKIVSSAVRGIWYYVGEYKLRICGKNWTVKNHEFHPSKRLISKRIYKMLEKLNC